MKQRIGILLTSISLLPCIAMAQSNVDLKKQYEEFRRQAIKEYRDFRHECNREYAEFMRKAWREFQVSEPIPAPKEEIVPPVVRPIDDQSVTPITPIDERGAEPHVEVVEIPECLPQPLPVAPIGEELQPMEQYFTFTYCGTQCRVRLGDRHRFNLPYCNEGEMARVWEDCSSVKFDNVIRDCLELRIRHSLCDWAYLQMLVALGNSFFEAESNEATLLTAYLYCQSGYKMRLAHDKQKLYLLIASKHTIYEYKYFTIEGENYYLLEKEVHTPLHICEASYPEEQALSLWLEKAPVLDVMYTDGRVLQDKSYPEMQAEVYTNENLLRFFESYPPSEVGGNKVTCWAMYAQTPLDKEIMEHLYPMLKEQLSGLTEEEAANRLLHFVQTAFEYGYDEEQWGRDRAFFAEETLFYPYSDCEDRAILFSHLVRDLLGLDVALIYYPGHLATAVCFNKEVSGDYLTIDNRRFIICDPTYVNASVGESMPTVDSDNIMVSMLKRNIYDEDYEITLSNQSGKEDLFTSIVIPADSVVFENETKPYEYILANKGYGWYYCEGFHDADYASFEEYNMDSVSYENNIFSEPYKFGMFSRKFIILQQKSNNKFGVFRMWPLAGFESEYVVIPFIYDSITFVRDDKSRVEVYNAETGERKVLSLIEKDSCEDNENMVLSDSCLAKKIDIKQSLFPICVDGKYGYQNAAGKIIVSCEYDSVSGYERGDKYAYIAHENGLMDLYDYRGRKLAQGTSVLDYIPTVLWHSETDTIDAQVLVKTEWGWDYCGFADHESYDVESEYDFSNINGQNYESSISSITTNGEIQHFIILRQKKDNKYGVFKFWPTYNHVDEYIFIPFIYDSITFVKEDKSKVEVYRADTGERKIISLIE